MSPEESPEEYSVKRRTPRYPFTAPAAVLPQTGPPVGGNIKELSLYGCYLDSASTLPPRARVLLKIFVPGEYFEAQATVAYATPALGMGLVFRDVQPHFRSVLRKWLLMAMQRLPFEVTARIFGRPGLPTPSGNPLPTGAVVATAFAITALSAGVTWWRVTRVEVTR